MLNRKSKFQPSLCSQLTHELNIPLTGILGMIQFLKKTSLTPEQRNYIKTLSISAKRLCGFEEKMKAILKKN